MHSKKFEFTLHYANLSLVPEKFQRQMHHGRTCVKVKAATVAMNEILCLKNEGA